MSEKSYIERNKGKISQSKLKVFIENMEDYKLQYIDEISLPQEDWRHFVIWTALHDALGYWMDYFNKKYFLQNKNMLKDDYINALEEMWYSTEWKVSELEKRFYEAKWNPIKLTAWESEMLTSMLEEVARQPLTDIWWNYLKEQEIEVEYTSSRWNWKLILKWTLDRIDTEKKLIRDWKTCASITKLLKDITWGDKSYLFQISFYWLLAKINYWIECEAVLDMIDKTKNTCYYGLKITREQILEQIPIITKSLDDLIDENNKMKEWKPCFMSITNDEIEKTFESKTYKFQKSSIQKEFWYIETK